MFWGHFMFAPSPYRVDKYDLTLPMSWWFTLCIFIPAFFGLGACLSAESFRRLYFRHFSTVHNFSALLLVLFSLWHASYFWYFALPPLCLMAYDHWTRLCNSFEFVSIRSMVLSHRIRVPKHKPDSAEGGFAYPGHDTRHCNNRSGRMSIVKLSLKMPSAFKTSSDVEGARQVPVSPRVIGASPSGDTVEYGLYYRVNFPWLSLSQWHPFYVHKIDRDAKMFSLMAECAHLPDDGQRSRLVMPLQGVNNTVWASVTSFLASLTGRPVGGVNGPGVAMNQVSWSTMMLEEKIKIASFGVRGGAREFSFFFIFIFILLF